MYFHLPGNLSAFQLCWNPIVVFDKPRQFSHDLHLFVLVWKPLIEFFKGIKGPTQRFLRPIGASGAKPTAKSHPLLRGKMNHLRYFFIRE